MTRISITSLLACSVAVLVALRLGGPQGNGVLMGFGAGAGISGLGVLYQRHVLLTRPELALRVFTLLFLAKLLALMAGGLVLRYVETAAQRADWKTFLVSFAAAVAVIVPVGSIEALRTLKSRSLARTPS